MEKLKSRAACICLLAALAGLSGCVVVVAAGVGVAAGAGVVYWVEGAAHTTLGHPIQQVHDATLDALKKLGAAVPIDKTDAFSGEIESTLQGGSSVSIGLKAVSASVTNVTIRVGTLGDRDQSDRVLDAIETRLGDRPR